MVEALEAAGGRIPGARRARLREEALREGLELGEALRAELAKLGFKLQGGLA
jgi:(2R)-3-sulfolactate dehydrogenase (NADP+)